MQVPLAVPSSAVCVLQVVMPKFPKVVPFHSTLDGQHELLLLKI
jgi:hypothetical protein